MGNKSMKKSMDYTFAREAQLMYQRAPGFVPEKGDLKKWVGEIPGRGQHSGVRFKVEISVPESFPNDPPSLKVLTPCSHPNVMDDGTLLLRIIDQWKADFHLYQVVNSIKGLFARAPPMPVAATPLPKAEVAAEPETVTVSVEEEAETLKQKLGLMEQEMKRLQQNVVKRDEELAKIKARMLVHNVPESGEVVEETLVMPASKPERDLLELEGEKIAAEDLLASLEEKFAAGEISAADYTKLYRQYKKQLYMINKALEEKQTK